MRLFLVLLLMLPVLALGVGDPAPSFKLEASDGKTYSLDQFHGKSWVVLNFFPKPFTSGCTTQLCNLRDQAEKLAPYRAFILAADTSSLEVNRDFAAKEGYRFPLLADTDQSLARDYGVLMPGGVAARRTFVIDPEGVVRASFDATPARATDQVVEALEALGVPKD